MCWDTSVQFFSSWLGGYQSPDYERAPYRAELRLEAGASSVTVR